MLGFFFLVFFWGGGVEGGGGEGTVAYKINSISKLCYTGCHKFITHILQNLPTTLV